MTTVRTVTMDIGIQEPSIPWVARIRAWVALAALHPLVSFANPQGVTVVGGTANVTTTGSRTDVTTGPLSVLQWQSFNIAPGESTVFHQPSSSSVAFNWIGGQQPSQIFGSLSANGSLILANSQGFYFGPNAFVSVGGSLVVTTTALPPDMGSGGTWQFTGPAPQMSIVNYGRIEARNGGGLFLIADQIENHGSISAPEGQIGLYAGKDVLLTHRADGKGLSVQVTLPQGSVSNTGQVIADAGEICLQARTINQDGIVQANSMRTQNGVVELVADDSLNLGAASSIRAAGDGSKGSSGGTVTLRSGHTFSDHVGSQIDASGSPGGAVEISAPSILSLDSSARAGHFLLDPTDIVLGTTGTGKVGAGGGVIWTDPPSTLKLNVLTAFRNWQVNDIVLEATHDITLSTGTSWDLSASTSLSSGEHLLTLRAGNNINFQNGSKITDANQWSVSLQAGRNFSSGRVQSGTGNIYLNGGVGGTASGSIQTAQGNIQLTAGQDVLVGSGFLGTVNGGSVTVNALAGSINAGTRNDGYLYTISGYYVGPGGLGGITTSHGGNVTLDAGLDVISVPTTPLKQAPGASGTYGVEPGNVSVVAKRNIVGNYLVRNGSGTLVAGVDISGSKPEVKRSDAAIGTALNVVNLSLVSGSWSIWSGGTIQLGEVRNPNGTFNFNRLPVDPSQYVGNQSDQGTVAVPAKSAFLFDYAPTASASLWAGNAITLAGQNLPRVAGQNQGAQPVYPPQLSLNAGAGGIQIENPLTLYPSSTGSLAIRTRDGGSLSGTPIQGGLTTLTMSDSGLPGYATFGSSHAVVPLHLKDPGKVEIDVSGDIYNLALVVPMAADIHVSGSTYNFGFLGQNVRTTDTTTLQVDHTIRYRGVITSVDAADGWPATASDPTISSLPQAVEKLSYSATTHQLTFIGQMSAAEYQYLSNPQRLVLDITGQPVLQADGTPQTAPILLTDGQRAAIAALYAASQSASLGDQGLALSGPGQFQIKAGSVDLGVSGGISVQAASAGLEALVPTGAALTIDTTAQEGEVGDGNLSMTASRISNEALGGSITIQAAGRIDVGTQQTALGAGNQPRGIYTSGGGGIQITAQGDVQVNGSRVAAYDGGNIRIFSATGDINAGSGGSGAVTFNATELEPVSGAAVHFPATIPGSGILSTTLAGGIARLGNVDLETPNGSIRANSGGIIQIPFNDAPDDGAIRLTAGRDIESGNSGIIGGRISLKAGGQIGGIVVGSGQVNIVSEHSVSVAVFAGGSVNISAGTTVSGTVVGAGTVDVAGGTITAALISKSVSTTGDASSASVGIPAAAVPRPESQVADAGKAVGRSEDHLGGQGGGQAKNTRPRLTRTVPRVTVILPGRVN